MRRLVAVAAAAGLILVIGLLATTGSEAGPKRQEATRFFGVNAPLLRDYATPDRLAALDAQAQGMQQVGIGWARIVFDQAVEQRTQGGTDWTIPDAVVSALARHGIRTDALFMGAADWTQAPVVSGLCGSRGAPVDRSSWAAFTADTARRYGSNGVFWRQHPQLPELPIRTYEIWNEPNLSRFWCPAADPIGYAELFDRSSAAIAAADPQAHVVVGGLATNFNSSPGVIGLEQFLRVMLAARPGLADRIGAVAIHPYGPTPADVLDRIERSREALREVGLAQTPLLVNEVGWHTQGFPGPLLAPEPVRASRVSELTSVADATNCGIEAFGLHDWVSAERNPLDPSDWYGIADPRTGQPRASASAYAEEIRDASAGGTGALGIAAATVCG